MQQIAFSVVPNLQPVQDISFRAVYTQIALRPINFLSLKYTKDYKPQKRCASARAKRICAVKECQKGFLLNLEPLEVHLYYQQILIKLT